jgi:hypothetical protein
VLVHCSQGVSRSATLAIAYLMWKRGAGYDDVFREVKAARGVTNPNIGFICQVALLWGWMVVVCVCGGGGGARARAQRLIVLPVDWGWGAGLRPRACQACAG